MNPIGRLLLLGAWSLAGNVSAAITIPTVSAGDGYHHNELGTSYDFFDASSTSASAYYTYWGTSDTVQHNIGYLQFSLGSVTPSTPTTVITLHLNITSSHYSSDSPSAGFVKHVAAPTAANGNASQRLAGTEQVVEIKDQGTGWLSLDVTAMVQNDLANDYAYSCFSLDPNTAGYFRDAGFSVSTAESGNAPYLSFAVPEPPAALLGIGGLLMLLHRRRRLA